MKTLSIFILILMSLSGTTSSADSNCESEVHPGIAALVGLTRKIVARQALTDADIQAMIDGETIENPFLRKPRSDLNLSFGRGLAQVIREVRDNTPAAKAALTKLRTELLGDASQVADAKEGTRRTVNPHLLLEIESPGESHRRLLHWHRNSESELQFVVFYPDDQKLRIYSTKIATPLIERSFGTQQSKILSPIESQGLLSTSDGRLFVASSGEREGKNRILVHDVSNDKTFDLPTEGRVGNISLFEGTAGDVYLGLISMDSLEIFRVQDGIHHVQTIRKGILNVSSSEFVKGPHGRAAAIIYSASSIYLVDLPSGNILRQFTAPHEVLKTKAILIGENDFAVSVVFTKSSDSAAMNLAFLTSHAPQPLEMPFTFSWGNLGDFQLTKEGHILFPVLQNGNHGAGHIFDVFHSPIKTKFVSYFPPRRRSTIHPIKSFSLGEMGQSELQWLKTADDLILSIAYAPQAAASRITQWEQKNFSVYAPNGQVGKMINRIEADHYEFLLAEVLGQQVLLHSHSGTTSSLQAVDIGSGSKLAHSLGGANRISTALQSDRNGDHIFASTNQGVRPNQPIYLIQMTKE